MSLIRCESRNIDWRTFVVFVVFNAQMVPFFSLGGLVLMACLDSVYIYIEWKDRGYEVESWAKRYWDIWHVRGLGW